MQDPTFPHENLDEKLSKYVARVYFNAARAASTGTGS